MLKRSNRKPPSPTFLSRDATCRCWYLGQRLVAKRQKAKRLEWQVLAPTWLSFVELVRIFFSSGRAYTLFSSGRGIHSDSQWSAPHFFSYLSTPEFYSWFSQISGTDVFLKKDSPQNIKCCAPNCISSIQFLIKVSSICRNNAFLRRHLHIVAMTAAKATQQMRLENTLFLY